MSVYPRGDIWWYSFSFAGRRIQESAKTRSKTLAKLAEQKRRRQLEKGFNGLEDTRDGRVKTVQELAEAYLEDYRVRHKSVTYATYAVGNVTRHLGDVMVVDVTDRTVKAYQTARLKEKAAPKTINEEVGFLLRILEDAGDAIRARMRRQKTLKLPVRQRIGRAYTPEEKAAMLKAAREARSRAIYPALMLALNAGVRDAENRKLQWTRMDLSKAFLTVGESKSEAGEGRTIPLNSALLEAMVEYAKWYTKRFGSIEPHWYVFPFGKPLPKDPTRPMVSLKTAWRNVRAKAGVTGRWHDNRHTFITDLAESGEAGDETIRDLAGHVSKQMLKHYSHIRLQAKRRAVEALVKKGTDAGHLESAPALPEISANSEAISTKSTTLGRVN